MSSRILALAFVLTLLGAVEAHAFDGHRKGFVLGFGAGPGYLDFSQGIESSFGVQTDFKIGVGLNEQNLLHYTGKQIWHVENDITYTEALPMIGLTHYMKPEAPSPFVSGGAGLGFLATFEDDIGGDAGPATYLSAGYEFARHWNVELGVAVTWVEGARFYNASLTLNVLGY